MREPVVKKTAWKPYAEQPGGLAACEWSDEAASQFCLSWPGRGYPEQTLDFANRHLADGVARAMEQVYTAGGRRAFADLRAFIGQ